MGKQQAKTGRPTYQEVTAHIMSVVDGMDAGGQIEYIKGPWCFAVDYRVRGGKAEYWCPMLFHEGDETGCPWPDSSFDMDCQPPRGEGHTWPDIMDYGEFM